MQVLDEWRQFAVCGFQFVVPLCRIQLFNARLCVVKGSLNINCQHMMPVNHSQQISELQTANYKLETSLSSPSLWQKKRK